MKEKLTLESIKTSVVAFTREFGKQKHPSLFGVTDGKAVGTFVEHSFHDYLRVRYSYKIGSSARGIDFPSINTDLKVTSIRQPQSSCPFKSARQKVYGLGYNLVVFVYKKNDDERKKVAQLTFKHAIFVSEDSTADYQTTTGLCDILDHDGNVDDIIAFLEERNLPLDEIGRVNLAEYIMQERPKIGFLTVSNALQWRLQYGRIVSISEEGGTEGVVNLLAYKE